MRGMEFGGFSSWRAFTEHCCCMPRTQARKEGAQHV